jgi:hypothetical protein
LNTAQGKSKVRIEIRAEYKPDSEAMLQALMIALDLDPVSKDEEDDLPVISESVS